MTTGQEALIDVLKQIKLQSTMICMFLIGLSFPNLNKEQIKRIESASISQLLQKADLNNPDQSSWVKILGKNK